MVGIAAHLSNAGWSSALPPAEQLEFIHRGFGTDVYSVPGIVVVRIARTAEAGEGLALWPSSRASY